MGAELEKVTHLDTNIAPYKVSGNAETLLLIFYGSHIPDDDEGARFENMVAVGLNRLCNQLRENGLGPYKLFFVRDLSKREVDFLIAKGETPVLLVESKTNNLKISGFALNLAKKLGDIPIIQLNHKSGVLKQVGKNASVISASHFFSCLP